MAHAVRRDAQVLKFKPVECGVEELLELVEGEGEEHGVRRGRGLEALQQFCHLAASCRR